MNKAETFIQSICRQKLNSSVYNNNSLNTAIENIGSTTKDDSTEAYRTQSISDIQIYIQIYCKYIVDIADKADKADNADITVRLL